MTTTSKTNQTSTPREFFERLYGDLDNNKNKRTERTKNYLTSEEQISNIITPIPLLPAPITFPFHSNGETHFSAAAAAGLSAFCKYFFSIILI